MDTNLFPLLRDIDPNEIVLVLGKKKKDSKGRIVYANFKNGQPVLFRLGTWTDNLASSDVATRLAAMQQLVTAASSFQNNPLDDNGLQKANSLLYVSGVDPRDIAVLQQINERYIDFLHANQTELWGEKSSFDRNGIVQAKFHPMVEMNRDALCVRTKLHYTGSTRATEVIQQKATLVECFNGKVEEIKVNQPCCLLCKLAGVTVLATQAPATIDVMHYGGAFIDIMSIARQSGLKMFTGMTMGNTPSEPEPMDDDDNQTFVDGYNAA